VCGTIVSRGGIPHRNIPRRRLCQLGYMRSFISARRPCFFLSRPLKIAIGHLSAFPLTCLKNRTANNRPTGAVLSGCCRLQSACLYYTAQNKPSANSQTKPKVCSQQHSLGNIRKHILFRIQGLEIAARCDFSILLRCSNTLTYLQTYMNWSEEGDPVLRRVYWSRALSPGLGAAARN